MTQQKPRQRAGFFLAPSGSRDDDRTVFGRTVKVRSRSHPQHVSDVELFRNFTNGRVAVLEAKCRGACGNLQLRNFRKQIELLLRQAVREAAFLLVGANSMIQRTVFLPQPTRAHVLMQICEHGRSS